MSFATYVVLQVRESCCDSTVSILSKPYLGFRAPSGIEPLRKPLALLLLRVNRTFDIAKVVESARFIERIVSELRVINLQSSCNRSGSCRYRILTDVILI